ncbi:hypothetical protein PMAC_001057, partial [Pneumocystis sp. 'macacae']
MVCTVGDGVRRGRGGARGKKVGCTAEIGWEEGVHQAASRGRLRAGEGVQVRVRGADKVGCAVCSVLIRGGEVGDTGDKK